VDPAEMIETILTWAEDHPNFDTSFVDDLNDQLSSGDLSDSQVTALENIIEKWRIQ
jgi:hypothetical protein